MTALPSRSVTQAVSGSRAWFTRLLTIPIYLGCTLAFVADVTHQIHLAFGLFYIPLICTAVFHRNPRSAWWLASIAAILVTLGFFFPEMNPDRMTAVGNRLLSIVGIFITATLVRHARMIQEQLAEQTRRAEEGEQLKTEIFTVLSEEIRKPLHALVGLCSVMMANCRPDQRASLGQVQDSGKTLLAMIENLIDLTNIDKRTIHLESVDPNALIREAADAVRGTAAARSIQVAIEAMDPPIRNAHADPWAVRRILDNLLANALNLSPAGSVVELATEMAPDSVTLVVRDCGHGVPPEVLTQLEAPAPGRLTSRIAGSETGAGIGLTLSQQLARAMGAELTVDSELGYGTTARLTLPT